MNTIALHSHSLSSHPVGRRLINVFSNLDKGNYALLPDTATGNTQLLKQTPSRGTDFYKYVSTVTLPFEAIKRANLLPNYPVELNASPAGSESQEYAKDSLVFFV